jgi:hypothetical protein
MTSADEETIAVLRRATSEAIDRLRELGLRYREQEERIAFLEKQLAAHQGPTPLPADIIAAPIPDEQWKPHVAVGVTDGVSVSTGPLEDDLLRQVYRQNRVTPEKPVEGG